MHDQERQTALILPFTPRVQTGGKEPPGSGNWLGRMVQGTRFLARRKSQAGSEVDDFVVYMIMPEVVLLARNTYARDGEVSWHDPKIFCKNYEYYITLEVLENKNGNDNKISAGSVAGDVKPEVIDILDETE